MEEINAALANNLSYIFAVIGIIFVIMIGFIVSLELRLSNMKKRFRRIDERRRKFKPSRNFAETRRKNKFGC